MHRNRLCALAAAVFAFALAGCPTDPDLTEAEQGPPPLPLHAGETVLIEVAADGMWHATPYLAMAGHVWKFSPTGGSIGLAPAALRFRIDIVPYVMVPDEVFRITQPGRLSVRIHPRLMAGAGEMIAVQLQRVE